MKHAYKLILIFISILLLPLSSNAADAYTPPKVEIDWPSFLAKQDPVWDRLPTEFDEGAQLGNGLACFMVSTWARDGL